MALFCTTYYLTTVSLKLRGNVMLKWPFIVIHDCIQTGKTETLK